MQRRAFLRTGGAAGLALAVPTSIAAATAPDESSSDASPDGYEPLGRVEVTGAAEAVVADDGETAYVAGTDSGFATVDISDPADPAVLAEEYPLEVGDTPFVEIYDVKVDGDRLAVVGPANPNDDDVFHGFELYDVSDPADPVVVDEPYETGFHIHNCALEDGLLYVVANGEDENPLVVYDVSDDEVSELGRWSLVEHEPEWGDAFWMARYLHDVTVHDGVAYLAHWNAGTYLLDVSDPSDPEYVSRVADTTLEETLDLDDRDAQIGLPGNDHYAAVDDTGDLLAVGREAWATGGDDPDGPGGIDLYDVSDPAEPEELAHWYDTEAAAFWTARVAVPGETFVASSTPLVPGTDFDGALYTFPTDPDGGSAGGSTDLLDPIPGFTGTVGAAGLAGGAVALEWLRRRRDGADR